MAVLLQGKEPQKLPQNYQGARLGQETESLSQPLE
jgi:hypothetical protein